MINPERYKQIDELFQAALEIEPAKRSAFLSSACGKDVSLREEVEALLTSSGQEWSLIDGPVPEITALFLPEQQQQLTAEESFGYYCILSLLGTGGMGQVYLAEDSRLGRKVALKLLPAVFTKNDLRLRLFQQEARAASALNHPSILTIYDIGEIDGKNFIATEFVEGETLRHRMKTALSFEDALGVVVQVASALSAAHQAGIIHRDIKPENIMLRQDGLVKVLDFGLAKLVERPGDVAELESTSEFESSKAERPDLVAVGSRTDTAGVMGTLPYMSPEQIRGESTDGRSDIFSLGVVLYEMITGHTPFTGDTNADLIASMLEEDPPRLDLTLPKFTNDLQRIVDKTLTKNREQRYQTIDDVVNDLKKLIERSAGSGTPATRSNAAKVYGSRVLLLSAAIIVALLATYTLIKSIRKSYEPSRYMKIAAVAGGDKCVEAAISGSGKYIVYVIQDAGKETMWLRDLAGNTKTQLSQEAGIGYGGLTFSPDDKSIFYIRTDENPATLYRIPALGGDPEKVLAGVGNPITFSPDGKMLAFERDFGKGRTAIVKSNVDASGEQVLAERLLPAYFSGSLSWSPDGKVIACCEGVAGGGERYMKVTGIEIERGAETEISSKKWRDISDVAWLRDGSGLILSAVDHDRNAPLQLWRLSYPGGELGKITNDLNSYGSISLTSDSTTLVTIRFESRTNLWIAPNGDSARAAPITSGTHDLYMFVSWTPDGRLVYPSSASGNRDLLMIQADGTGQTQLTSDAGNNLQSSVSPDGRYLVFSSSRDAGTYNIWRMEIDGSNPVQLTHGSGEVQPRCSPDGKWVIYTSGGPEGDIVDRTIWKVPIDGGNSLRLTDKPSNWPDVSPDGKLVACWYKDDSASPWQIAIVAFAGGPPLKLFKGPSNPGRAIRWSPDGKAVTFIVTRDAISNIWAQEISGGAPEQITHFTSEEMRCFDWAKDGRLVCSRFSNVRDLVLISDFDDSYPRGAE